MIYLNDFFLYAINKKTKTKKKKPSLALCRTEQPGIEVQGVISDS